MTLTVHIPGRPVPKGRPRFTRSGRAYTPKRTREYQRKVADHALVSRNAERTWPTDARYHVRVTAHVLTERSPGDVDNYAKAALDGCNGVLWLDDRQVVSCHAERVVGGKGNEGLTIKVQLDALGTAPCDCGQEACVECACAEVGT